MTKNVFDVFHLVTLNIVAQMNISVRLRYM